MKTNLPITFLKVTSIIPSLILCLISFNLEAQTVFWSEDFETDGTGTRYMAAGQFLDGDDGSAEDFFGRVENVAGVLTFVNDCGGGGVLDITNPFSGQSGNFFMAGEDMDDTGGCGNPIGADDREVTFLAANGHGINIMGASEMTFRILVANGADNICGGATSRWDVGEGLKVVYSKDGGAEVEALCFAPNLECNIPGDNTNEPLNLDLNCDGDGEDGFVNNVFSEYTFIIPAGGNSLDLKVLIDADAGDEEIAFDNLRLESINVPLPVELIQFSGKPNNEFVELDWSTASEVNNKGFEIEHSLNGLDWNILDFVEGRGTSSDLNRYQYIHDQPSSGNNFYRLTQIDYDGAFENSKIVMVNFKNSKINFTAYPNPFTDKLEIRVDNAYDQDAVIRIYDILGNQVNSFMLERGNVQKELNLSDLNAGAYFIQMDNGLKVINTRIVKF